MNRPGAPLGGKGGPPPRAPFGGNGGIPLNGYSQHAGTTVQQQKFADLEVAYLEAPYQEEASDHLVGKGAHLEVPSYQAVGMEDELQRGVSNQGGARSDETYDREDRRTQAPRIPSGVLRRTSEALGVGDRTQSHQEGDRHWTHTRL